MLVEDLAKPYAPLGLGAPISNGALESLKWLALVLMTFDHVNKYLLQGSTPWMFAMGRLAMPVFAFVLGCNLARESSNAAPQPRDLLVRLATWGAAASVPFVLLGGLGWGWWPVNIMFTFAVGVCAVKLIEKRRMAAAALVFVAGGAVVEFWWPGLLVLITAWAYAKHATAGRLIGWLLAIASLYVVNGNWWAMAAPLVIAVVSHANVQVPRFRHAFYVYYPAHLAVILALTKT